MAVVRGAAKWRIGDERVDPAYANVEEPCFEQEVAHRVLHLGDLVVISSIGLELDLDPRADSGDLADEARAYDVSENPG